MKLATFEPVEKLETLYHHNLLPPSALYNWEKTPALLTEGRKGLNCMSNTLIFLETALVLVSVLPES